MRFLLITLFVLPALIAHTQSGSGNQKPAPARSKFALAGKVTGFPDKTVFVLKNKDMKVIDSASTVNGLFTFQGSLKESVEQVIIVTKDMRDYKIFWAENADMTFTAEKGKFRNAVITGSYTQKEADELEALVESKKVQGNPYMHFIRSHPNSLISTSVLSVYATTWGKDTVSVLYNTLTEEMKTTSYGKNVSEYIALNRNIKIGDKFVDFTQKTPEGKSIKLSDYAGKIVLLDFWASWCGPCRMENPELVKTYQQFKEKGFEIVGVSLDTETHKEGWIKAIQKDGLIWPNISDLNGPQNKAALIYGVSGIPDNFLIDRNGTIIDRDLRGEALRQRLSELLR